MMTNEQIDEHVATVVRGMNAPTKGTNMKDGQQSATALATHAFKCLSSIASSLETLSKSASEKMI